MKNSWIYCILTIILIHLAAFFIVSKFFPTLNASFLIKEISYSGVILCLGTLIMYVKYQKGQFVARFMGATVFQMLAILTFVLALVYLKVKPLQTHGLLFIIIYIIGMIGQTAFFLLHSKQTSK